MPRSWWDSVAQVGFPRGRRDSVSQVKSIAKGWASVEQPANDFGVAEDSVHRWIENRRLLTHNIGPLWNFWLTEVDERTHAGGTHGPDPRKDDSFRRFKDNPKFQNLVASWGSEYPRQITIPKLSEGPDSQQESAQQKNSPSSDVIVQENQPEKAVARPKPRITKPLTGQQIFFVPIGDFPLADLKTLADYYHRWLKVEIEILGPIPIEEAVVDRVREQLVAETLIASMRRALPQLANDSNAILIGFTTGDMYPLSMGNWRFAFGWRDPRQRAAVVSTARLDFINLAASPDVARPEVRVRKVVTKDIAILYYGLGVSNDPRSVLYGGIMGIEDLDAVSEEF